MNKVGTSLNEILDHIFIIIIFPCAEVFDTSSGSIFMKKVETLPVIKVAGDFS